MVVVVVVWSYQCNERETRERRLRTGGYIYINSIYTIEDEQLHNLPGGESELRTSMLIMPTEVLSLDSLGSLAVPLLLSEQEEEEEVLVWSLLRSD